MFLLFVLNIGTISKTYPKEYIHTKLPCLTPQNDDFQTGQPSLKSQRDGQKDIQNLMSKGDDFQTDLPSLKSQRDRQKDMQNLMSQVDDVQTVLPSLMPQNENHHTKLPNLKSEKEESKTDLPSLMSCIKQPVFISHCLWFSLLLLRFLYFIGSLNNYLNRVLHGDKDLGLSFI